jgi:hypothetical protein
MASSVPGGCHVPDVHVAPQIPLALVRLTARRRLRGRVRYRTSIRRRRWLLSVIRMTRANDEAAGAARGFVSPFTQVDDTSADIRQELGDYLDRLAILPGIQRVRRTARAALDLRSGQHLLDAGCGAGEEARELARLVGPAGAVTPIDLSSDLGPPRGGAARAAVCDTTSVTSPRSPFLTRRSTACGRNVCSSTWRIQTRPSPNSSGDRPRRPGVLDRHRLGALPCGWHARGCLQRAAAARAGTERH